MNIIKTIISSVYVVVPLTMLLISGCMNGPSTKSNQENVIELQTNSKLSYSDTSHSVTQVTNDKKYITKLFSNLFPLKTGKVHSWILEVRTTDGKPLEKAKIYVHGGMPIHRHGFPTRPRVTKYLGEGKYLIEGVKFSMSGEWEMRFNIKEETKRDRAVYKISL